MQKSWTIKTPEGDRDFETPQEAAEYLKRRRGSLSEKAAPASVVPEYSSRLAKVDEVKAETIPTKKRTMTRRAEITGPTGSTGLSELDFSLYSLAELDEIIAKANEAKTTFFDRRRAQLLAELEALDALEKDVTAPPERKRRKETRPRKLKLYQDDEGNVWRGVGKKPFWLEDRLAKGAKLEDFLVEDPES